MQRITTFGIFILLNNNNNKKIEGANKRLAHTRSSLVDLSLNFSQIKRPNIRDISIFREQFYTLILNATANDRQEISYILSACEYAPKPIILFLAMEEIGIAHHVLKKSAVLKARDLNMMVGKVASAHLKLIAGRDDVDIEVVQSLLKADSEDNHIQSILEANPACFENEDIMAIINAPEMLEEIEESEITITSVDEHSLKMPEVKKPQKDLSKDLVALANRGGKLSRMPVGKKPKPEILPLNKKQVERQLLASARAHDIRSFSHFVERYCGLKREITLDFLMKQNAGMLATLLCALELSNVSAARIMLMLNNNIGRNGHIFKNVMNKYSALNKDECTSFFEKQGATFKGSIGVEHFDPKTTRYALSLAARERRAALLKEQEKLPIKDFDERLTA